MFPDDEACLLSVRELRSELAGAAVLPARDERGMWSWRLRVGDVGLAASSRRYQRRIRAQEAGESFRHYAAETGEVETVRLASSSGLLIESC